MANVTILPFDLTGSLASNLKTGEEHTLTKVDGRTNRMFCPKFGAYYKDSLDVRTSAGVPLVYDKDYVCTYYYDELWDLNAKACCAIIVVVNPSVGNDIRISYQAVGGPYSLSIDEISDLIHEVSTALPPLKWEDIRNKPLQFPPSLHYHEYWQLYGLESTVKNLELLGHAWSVGRKGILADNRFYYKNTIDLARQAVTDYTAKVMAHITDRQNPHLTDKFKIGLGLVNNWPMANEPESVSISINDKYQPIGGVYDQLTTHIVPIFDGHITNRQNPHRLTLNDPLLNLYSATEIQALFNDKLARTDVAYESTLFEGNDLTTLYNNFRSNLPTSSIAANQKLPLDRMAPPVAGWNPNDYVLMGDNTFAPWSSLVKSYNDTQGSVYYIGAQSQESFNYVSTGTYVIRGVYEDFYVNTMMMRLVVYVKTATGFQKIS